MLFLKKTKILMISVLVIITVLILFSNVNVEGLNPFRTVSTSERIKSEKIAIDIAKKNLLTGVGFNAYRDAQIRYGYRSAKGAAISNADAGTDNSYLFVLATTGIFGLLAFIGAYYNLVKSIPHRKDVVEFSVISSFAALFISSIFLNCLFYTPILSWIYLVYSFRNNLD